MKNITGIFILMLFVFVALFFTTSVFAQPAPSPPASGHYGGGPQGPGGGAPIDDGLDISLAMAAGFAGWKLFKQVKKNRLDRITHTFILRKED